MSRLQGRDDSPKRPRPIRLLILEARTDRVGRLAAREGLRVDELEDAIQLLAGRYPATSDDILAVIERHGLDRAADELEASVRGQA